jgi:hypothetical protein
VIVEASARLIAAARELDDVSKALVQTENVIEDLEPRYQGWIEDFIAALWDECIDEEKKFPPQDVRNAMAVKAMEPDLRRDYRACIRRRQKTKQRLTDLREIVAAQRSIVSAAKTEVEASEGPQPAWSPS